VITVSNDNEIYKAAGVDVEAGYEAVKLMKEDVKRTHNPFVLSDLGSFGGLFALPQGFEEPVLVSGTDGVGTKLKIAFSMEKHDTIGIDCVAMCVNDIVCQGARPLFFLDYIACGKNYPEKIADIVKGVSEGCVQGDMALIGGETAEMPDMYELDEYDLAGFAVGVAEKSEIITGEKIAEGNLLIGLPSSGVHSNGFSLVRKLCFTDNGLSTETYVDELGMTLGEALLEPTRIYVKPVQELMKKIKVNGISHITGGGFYENIPRMLQEGLTAEIDMKSFDILPVFKYLQKLGNISDDAMFSTFNMGIGMIVAINEKDLNMALDALKKTGENPAVIGRIIKGDKGIVLCP
jgi:phosphoribosylformylglycinamidine cyclo-ligase